MFFLTEIICKNYDSMYDRSITRANYTRPLICCSTIIGIKSSNQYLPT